MAIDPEARRILTGGIWASAAGALVQEPGDATPPVTRADGWGAPYSSTLVMEQETLQGRMNEWDSAITDIYESGVPFYDALLDYPEHCIVNEDGVLSRALRENGPNSANPAIAPSADTAGTTWEAVSGSQSAPSAPSQPTAIASNGALDWSWNCPLDGGSIITSFVLQWAPSGTDFSAGTEVTIDMPPLARYLIAGLPNGTAYKIRVRAVTAIGESGWSAVGTGTPVASVPVGGAAFALRAEAGDTEATLTWLEPDTGGAAIIRYEVQWRTSAQAFSSSRQQDVMDGSTTATISSLTNGTEYFFQVRAVNSVGSSTWSNEATATPAPSFREFTTAGAHSYSWEWDTPNGMAIIIGAGGGGGGGGGLVAGATETGAGGGGGGTTAGGNPRGGSATGGGAGGAGAAAGGRGSGPFYPGIPPSTVSGGGGGGGSTSCEIQGITYTARAGGGGGPSTNQAGNNAGYDGANSGAMSDRFGVGGDGVSHNGGAPGAGAPAGGRGGDGQVLIEFLTGLNTGDTWSIVVGAGGGGGGGRTNDGGDGGAGSVILIPQF